MALDVARWLVMFLKRPGGQAQFSTALALQAAEDRFGALHAWIDAHLAADLSLSVLAEQAGMSERSFSRHYTEATGLTRRVLSNDCGWRRHAGCSSTPRFPCRAV